MSFKPFKWVKKHPWEAAAIAAGVATGGFGLAGMGPLAALGGEAAAGAGAGALADVTAGGAFGGAADAVGGAFAGGGGLGGLGGMSALLQPLGEDFAAQMAGQTIAGNSSLLSSLGGSAESSLFGPLANDAKLAAAAQQAPAQLARKITPEMWLQASKGLMNMGQQRPLGAPQDFGPPLARAQQRTQEDITKEWLRRNDPNTFARMYGAQQPMMG